MTETPEQYRIIADALIREHTPKVALKPLLPIITLNHPSGLSGTTIFNDGTISHWEADDDVVIQHPNGDIKILDPYENDAATNLFDSVYEFMCHEHPSRPMTRSEQNHWARTRENAKHWD